MYNYNVTKLCASGSVPGLQMLLQSNVASDDLDIVSINCCNKATLVKQNFQIS